MAVERLSADDLTEFATETAASPRVVGAVLWLSEPVPGRPVREVLAERVTRIPRLRQRLVPTPFGLGRPIWVDDAAFDVSRHVTEHEVAGPVEEGAVLAVAARLASRVMPRDRPLWTAVLVIDTAGACHALVLALHHALADGIGGLAVLAALADDAASAARPPPRPTRLVPRPPPSRSELLHDVVVRRVEALRSLPGRLARLRAGAGELRGRRSGAPGTGRTEAPRRSSRATRTSLNRPIGPARELAVVRADLAGVISAAHRHEATVNDLLLAAVGGALRRLLTARGETLGTLVVSVPVAAPAPRGDDRLGNRVGVTTVRVPACADPTERLASIAGATRRRGRASERGSSAALLGLAFRFLARVHLFGWFAARQRLVNTFVTNLKGPERRLVVAGATIDEVVAFSPIGGNISVAFAALSYAGTLRVTVIADPGMCPDLGLLTAALHDELAALTDLPFPG